MDMVEMVADEIEMLSRALVGDLSLYSADRCPGQCRRGSRGYLPLAGSCRREVGGVGYETNSP